MAALGIDYQVEIPEKPASFLGTSASSEDSQEDEGSHYQSRRT